MKSPEQSELLEMIESLVSIAGHVHHTSPPDYAWSECADCGTETGEHKEDCVVGKAIALLDRHRRADSTAAILAPSSTGFDMQLIDDAEVIYDRSTETTRWVLWRHVTTHTLSLAMVQKDQVVSVTIGNLLFFCAKVLPEFCPRGTQSPP